MQCASTNHTDTIQDKVEKQLGSVLGQLHSVLHTFIICTIMSAGDNIRNIRKLLASTKIDFSCNPTYIAYRTSNLINMLTIVSMVMPVAREQLKLM